MPVKIVLWVIALTLLSQSSIIQARSAPLEEFKVIPIPEGQAIVSVNKAVEGSLTELSWRKKKELGSDPMSIKVTLLVRTHSITLNLVYDTQSLKASYVRSENMNYRMKDEKQTIHSSYNVWSQRLLTRLQSNIDLGEAYSFKEPQKSRLTKTNPPPFEAFSNFHPKTRDYCRHLL